MTCKEITREYCSNHFTSGNIKKKKKSHGDVEIDAAFVLVVADENSLDPSVGNIDGAREEEEDSEAGEQQAENH